jgi:hypothetical protein
LPFEDHPICEWPDWLLKEAKKPKSGARRHWAGQALTIPHSPNEPFALEQTGSFRKRSKSLLGLLEQAKEGNRHGCIYWVSCRFGNMIGERKVTWEVAELVLLSACRRLFGKAPNDNVRQTIRDGLNARYEEWVAYQSSRQVNGRSEGVGPPLGGGNQIKSPILRNFKIKNGKR